MRLPGLLALALVVSLLYACSLGMGPAFPQIVPQRGLSDCMIAALATMSRQRYDQVEQARLQAGVAFEPIGGLTAESAIKIALRLGHALILTRPPDLIGGRGILVFSYGEVGAAHATYLQAGYVFDPQADFATPWVMWLEQHPGAAPDYLLAER